jgi:hypothetical protein
MGAENQGNGKNDVSAAKGLSDSANGSKGQDFALTGQTNTEINDGVAAQAAQERADQADNNEWENAYVQRTLRDNLNDFAAAAGVAYDTKVIGVKGTTEQADAFNGINVSARSYINLNGGDSFAHTTGHELFHELERNEPELHA